MNLIKKHFKTLTPTDLHSIYKLRISVFVVEQNCPYQKELYEKVGFVQKSESFLEDGIPHVLMQYTE